MYILASASKCFVYTYQYPINIQYQCLNWLISFYQLTTLYSCCNFQISICPISVRGSCTWVGASNGRNPGESRYGWNWRSAFLGVGWVTCTICRDQFFWMKCFTRWKHMKIQVKCKKSLGKKALGGKRVWKEYLDYIDIAIPIPIIKIYKRDPLYQQQKHDPIENFMNQLSLPICVAEACESFPWPRTRASLRTWPQRMLPLQRRRPWRPWSAQKCMAIKDQLYRGH